MNRRGFLRRLPLLLGFVAAPKIPAALAPVVNSQSLLPIASGTAALGFAPVVAVRSLSVDGLNIDPDNYSVEWPARENRVMWTVFPISYPRYKEQT